MERWIAFHDSFVTCQVYFYGDSTDKRCSIYLFGKQPMQVHGRSLSRLHTAVT